MKELTVDAKVENLDEVLAFLREELEAHDCPPAKEMQMEVAAEELFVNVANYAYDGGDGKITVSIDVAEGNSCEISFKDSGAPFDPLAKEDPDVTLSAEERPIGGLGIYMVKKSMDAVEYEYRNGQNVLLIRKILSK
ncbi:MAG: ATP-binding protein [Lachnospiraceae bacterium]|nr:ATP-binding protein [Lachnospiraceae bacterium]